MIVYVDSVGLLAPGLPGWPLARQVLAGERAYTWQPMPAPAAGALPAMERRRSSETVRLAVSVAQEAADASSFSAGTLAAVFTSCNGDGRITHQICMAAVEPEPAVSPTQFHNSVHNAPAGYWSIATGATRASTSLCMSDASFAGALLEACTQAVVEAQPVLLVAYDIPLPPPLHTLHPLAGPFAVALVLAPQPTGQALARLQLALARDMLVTGLPEGMAAWDGHPAARALPLLQGIAQPAGQVIGLPYLDDMGVEVICRPC